MFCHQFLHLLMLFMEALIGHIRTERHKARAADAVAGRPAKDLLKGLCREQKQLIALLQAVGLIVASKVNDVDSHHPEG